MVPYRAMWWALREAQATFVDDSSWLDRQLVTFQEGRGKGN